MVDGMRTGERTLLMRWLLLAVVALGLVVMHHLPAQHGGGAHDSMVAVESSPTAQSMPDAGGMGAMLHDCLAVVGQFTIAALLMMLLVVGLARWIRERRPPTPSPLARAPDHLSPAGGRSLLASVCVLRL
jgi:hypothetical protein